jgi:hypothetical protein
MPDSLALPAIALLAAGLVALALVWPQGEGARSPGPFGQPLAPIVSLAPPPKPPPPAHVSPLRGREPPAASNAAAHPPT